MLFPVTLLFAPLIVMIKNYPRQLLVVDQAKRLQSMTSSLLHEVLAKVIVTIGFSVLGLLCGILSCVFGSLIGTLY